MWIYSILLLIIFLYYIIAHFIQNRFPIKSFRGKHVLITGGSAGLGKCFALKVAKAGANLTIIARDKTKLERTKQEILLIAPAAKVVIKSADCSNFDSLDLAVRESVNTMGVPDLVVANAGFSYPQYFVDAQLEIIEKEYKINYLGCLYLSKIVVPLMIEGKKGGNLAFVSSAIVFNPFIGYGTYSATKMAVRGLAESLRNELVMHNIGVHLFCPAGIDTDGFKEEQRTKPIECKHIEGNSQAYTPDDVASSLIEGLKRGSSYWTNEFFPCNVLRALSNSFFCPRDNPIFDACVAFIFILLSPFFIWSADRIVAKSKKATLLKPFS